MTRVDNDLFFDRDVVGLEGERTKDRFFVKTAPPNPSILWRIAASPITLAGVWFLAGVVGVFIDQASLLLQLVLGAPVFEELLKAGAALLLAGWVRRPLAARVACWLAAAWTVGAAFGWLEHQVGYQDESSILLAWRITFHAWSTGLTVTVLALTRSSDLRTRWAAPAGAILLHYVNNAWALVAGILTIGRPAGVLTMAVPALVTAAALGLTMAAPKWVPLLETRLAKRLARHPVRSA